MKDQSIPDELIQSAKKSKKGELVCIAKKGKGDNFRMGYLYKKDDSEIHSVVVRNRLLISIKEYEQDVGNLKEDILQHSDEDGISVLYLDEDFISQQELIAHTI